MSLINKAIIKEYIEQNLPAVQTEEVLIAIARLVRQDIRSLLADQDVGDDADSDEPQHPEDPVE